jgi:hypothetical protein
LNRGSSSSSSSRSSKAIKRREEEVIIDLTDSGNHNTMPVIRELEQDPVTGLVTMRSIIDPDKNSTFNNDSPIQFAEEDRGTAYPQRADPPDPEGDYEERLEAEGATILESTTFFPASNTRITKRSQTPEERAEQRMFEYYNK